ncbi:proprotein convertase subtilisin/kexin type 4 isoform X2 [Ascaphus truei]|uniref:proprotein convertase subtilisin/kexin type 4 isoform X2 n=1 Tax=Ascaphus truei TaxID=8439 RepID=UPI003F59DAD4
MSGGARGAGFMSMRVSAALTLTLGLRWAFALEIYTNSWAVRVPGGPEEVERIARRLGFISLGQVILGSDFYHLQHRGVQSKSFNPHWGRQIRLKKEPKVHWFEQQTLKRRRRRHISVVPTDPWFHKQWYMNNDVTPDLNVLTAWSRGYTGRGVVVTILDDGIEKDHPDLSENYDPMASYDFNSNDPDPQPRYNPSDENRHGTRCAGEVAAVANNGICGAGLAYNARIGGVRMLDGQITDIIEAQSLSLNPQHIHIYSASWGPEDDGKTVDGPGMLATEAFYRGIVNVTTDLHYRCTDQHTGTSASAPLAAGIIALALEANPTLTWRDMQHIVVRASRPANLIADDWVVNGVGRKVSHRYGYGLLDAGQLVDLAQKWETTRPQRRCLVKMVNTPQKLSSVLEVRWNVSACSSSFQHIRSLEHVQARISLSYSRRGDLEIFLTSPMGTRSVLVALRPYDTSTKGYTDWYFMSTHNWDEDPLGIWTLALSNKGDFGNNGYLTSATLILYGTDEDMMARNIQSSVLSECITLDSMGICRACESPFYAFGHLCLSYCPPKYFKTTQSVVTTDGETQKPHFTLVCASCHPSCHSCSGRSANNCTACPPLSTYDEKKRSCSEPHFPRTASGSTAPSQIIRITTVAAMIIGAPVAMFFLLSGLSWLLNRMYVYSRSRPWPPQATSVEMHTLNMESEDEGGAKQHESQGFLSHAERFGDGSSVEEP